MTTFQSILAQASELPLGDRMKLIDALQDTLPPEELPPPDSEWLAEIRRRYAACQSGQEKAIPWEQARAEALRKAGLRVPDATH